MDLPRLSHAHRPGCLTLTLTPTPTSTPTLTLTLTLALTPTPTPTPTLTLAPTLTLTPTDAPPIHSVEFDTISGLEKACGDLCRGMPERLVSSKVEGSNRRGDPREYDRN